MSTQLDGFQAIADASRRQILLMLAKEQCTINSIAENFDISRPAVSKHIKVLEQTGFILIEDRGRERYCKLNHQGFQQLQEWIGFFEGYWVDQLQKLEQYLDAKHGKL
jgi:DNA-binding transcriptional ArsR family regulator